MGVRFDRQVRLGLVSSARPGFSAKLAAEGRERAVEALRKVGAEPIVPSPEEMPHGVVGSRAEALRAARLFDECSVDGLVVVAGNFGDERSAAEVAARGPAGRPVFLFGLPEDRILDATHERRDAFCGALNIATAFRRRGIRYSVPPRAISDPDDPVFLAALDRFARAARLVSGVRGARIGQIGTRPAPFEVCAFDEISMLGRFGQSVVPIALATVFARARALPDDDPRVRRILDAMREGADIEICADSALRLAKLEAVLARFAEEEDLDALAVQCWTAIQEEYGVSACAAMARLSEQGIPSACEVDVHGAMSMLALALAAGRPTGLADWNNRHIEMDDVFSAWHCGVFPPSLARVRPRIRPHFGFESGDLAGRGDGAIEFPIAFGPITLFRITEDPDGAWRALIEEGESIEASGDPRGTHGWIRLRDLERTYRAVIRGFPHHVAIGPGRVGAALEEACGYLGIDAVVPNPIAR
ncbi:MAG: L-fucose/L-arabinose isomerase family protein [Planctomycetes bacterium]|nr:L-fucose/L-arabinose isomerase family protein [Planctomycetota bacterium]